MLYDGYCEVIKVLSRGVRVALGKKCVGLRQHEDGQRLRISLARHRQSSLAPHPAPRTPHPAPHSCARVHDISSAPPPTPAHSVV